jgi:hypothetical protein
MGHVGKFWSERVGPLSGQRSVQFGHEVKSSK